MKVIVHFNDTSSINIDSAPWCGESWGQLCQRFVETELLHPPRLLRLLHSLHPGGCRYLFRYGGGGYATIIRPTWSECGLNSNADARNMEGEEEDELVEANIILRPRGAFIAHLDMDFCVEKVGVAVSENSCGGWPFSLTLTPFPTDNSKTNVLSLKEHRRVAGVVDNFSIRKLEIEGCDSGATTSAGCASESRADVAAPARVNSPPAGTSSDSMANALNANIDSDGSETNCVAPARGPISSTMPAQGTKCEAASNDDGCVHTHTGGKTTRRLRNPPPNSGCWQELWEIHYEDLANFRREHGHCNVPKNHGDLGIWVLHQRELYRRKRTRKSRPAQERFDRLEGLGLDWNAGRRIPGEFFYKGTHWDIPESFQFPVGVTRLDGWRKWLEGSIHVDGEQQWQIKPYREISGHDLHSLELKDIHRMHWKPIFMKMMEAPGMAIPVNKDEIDESIVQSTYAVATEYLKSCFSYIFTAGEDRVNSYKIGTWSMKIKPSEVRKHGTEADIARLPPPTGRNHKRTFRVTKKGKERSGIRVDQEKDTA